MERRCCPRCGGELLILMYPARPIDENGHAHAVCSNWTICRWSTRHVWMTAGWEDRLRTWVDITLHASKVTGLTGPR